MAGDISRPAAATSSCPKTFKLDADCRVQGGMTMGQKTLATLVTVLLAIALPATAHQKTVLDPDDSPGPLDIVAARHRHRTIDFYGPGVGGLRTSLIFKVVTYERWSYEAIDGGKQFIAFEIDRDRDGSIDRCIVVTSEIPAEGAALGFQAKIYKRCTYFDDPLVRSFGSENLSRPDEHSLRVILPKRAVLGRGVKSYASRAATSFEEQNQDSPCRAPEPHADGGYGACADFTRWKRHSF